MNNLSALIQAEGVDPGFEPKQSSSQGYTHTHHALLPLDKVNTFYPGLLL